MKQNHITALTILAASLFCAALPRQSSAAPPDPSEFTTTVWAKNGMTRDPVALSFDNLGRLYLVESARRGTVDIDLRAHRDWLLDDLASDDFASMRDFFRRRMATERSEENRSWLKDRNKDGVHDYHDLTTISERIRLLEDTNGDGEADQSNVFAEDFNEEFTGVAAGVMPYGDDVFLTIYPDLWRLTDTDKDGVADKRESVFRGFGVHAALDGHDLHGLTVGPEGKIYFSCGDNGFSVRNREGELLHHPNTGGVLRMNPDGSGLEVFAIGLRNVQEFDWDQYGNMFAVDNDGDLEDERERAVYIPEGSDAGWRTTWQFRSPGWAKYNGGLTYNPWTAEGMWKPEHKNQPAYITPPMANYSVGPGGFKFNPGLGLNEAYRDFFFCVQFPVKQISAFRTQPRGAGFEMVDDHVFHSGLMVSSVNFGPAGGIYLADWVGKWQPNGEGVVYRVDDPKIDQSDDFKQRREEIRSLLHDGLTDHSLDALKQVIGHTDRRIRQLAQTELVRRRASDTLITISNQTSAHELARIHAIWGLIQLNQDSVNQTLSEKLPWKDPNAQIRQQCARAAGDLRLKNAEPRLVALLNDPAPLVVSHAAIALGKAGTDQSVAPLTRLLQRWKDSDPFIRHAAVTGLAGCTNDAPIDELRDDPSPAVRLGVVLAMRKRKDSSIAKFFNDPDARVRREAVRGAHDDMSIPRVLPQLAQILDTDVLKSTSKLGNELQDDESYMRRLISANLRVGDKQCSERLALFVIESPADTPIHQALQLEAFECLNAWQQSPLIDRVEGRIRKTKRAAPGAGKATIIKYISQFLSVNNPALTARATEVAEELDLDIDETQIVAGIRAAVRDGNSHTMGQALRVLHKRNSTHLPEILDSLLLGDWTTDSTIMNTAYEILVEREPNAAYKLGSQAASLGLKRAFVSQLPRFMSDEASQRMTNLLANPPAAHPEIVPELISAGKSHPSGDIAKRAAKLEATFASHPLGEYQFSGEQGNRENGEVIYRTHVAAQCVRCHNAGGQGKQAGPVLDGIATRVDRNQLLESIVNPSAKIAKGFDSVTLELIDGRLVSGSFIAETDSGIKVGKADGKTESIRRDQIEEIIQTQQSAMPTIRGVLSPIEVRDLVEYLSSLR